MPVEGVGVRIPPGAPVLSARSLVVCLLRVAGAQKRRADGWLGFVRAERAALFFRKREVGEEAQ